MRRAHIGLLALTLLLAGCGDGEGTDTTISSREAPAPDEAQTDQTPPPETTPGRAPASTVPVATPTTPTGGGGGPYDYGDAGDTTTTETTASDDGEDGGEGQAAGAIEAADSELGQILVGPDGLTLYVFLADEGSESTCYDSCAATWPPLEGELEAGAGVDETLLGSTERTDGTTQATYDGMPLYYYASDSEPGDVMGQGVGDNWFVVDPAGEVVDG